MCALGALLLSVLSAQGWAATPDTSTGPAHPEDAPVLLQEGQKLWSEGKYNEAIYPLKRLVDRHPGSPDYLLAHLLLGESYVRSDQPFQAVEPLRYYISTLLRKPNIAAAAVNRARISLGRAYLKLKQNKEAFLVSKEIEKQLGPEPAPGEDLVSALLIKTHSLIAQNMDKKAEQSLSSAFHQIARAAGLPAALQAESHYLHEELKLRACGRLPSPGKLTEDQARSQFQRRGLCVLEALLPFQNVIKTGAQDWIPQARTELLTGFAAYTKSCANPPKPPTRSGQRTPGQLKQYLAELRQALQEDCRDKLKQAVALLNDWAGRNRGKDDTQAAILSETGAAIERLL